MKILERDNQKRLAMYLDINVHCSIKKIVAQKNETITEWVKAAIIDKIKKEQGLGFDI